MGPTCADGMPLLLIVTTPANADEGTTPARESAAASSLSADATSVPEFPELVKCLTRLYTR